MVKKTKIEPIEEVKAKSVEKKVDSEDDYEMVVVGKDELGIRLWKRQKKSN